MAIVNVTKRAGKGESIAPPNGLPWGSPQNITDENNYASATIDVIHPTRLLRATKFGFNIPLNATITGIVATVRRTATYSGTVPDNDVRLIKNLSRVGTAKWGMYWPTSDLPMQVLGTSDDLWGTTWTPEEVNSPSFGIGIVAGPAIGKGGFNKVYSVDLTIYYDGSAKVISPSLEALQMIPIPKIYGKSKLSVASSAECTIKAENPVVSGKSRLIANAILATIFMEDLTIDEGEVLMMTVEELIARLDREFPNVRSNDDKVGWINDLEREIYTNIIKLSKSAKKSLVAGQNNYVVLPGFYVEDVIKVEVDGIEYYKASLVSHKARTYYNENGELCLDPVPVEDVADGLYIIYKARPNLKTVANIATDNLALPYDFVDLYLNYLKARICAVTKNYGEYNNWQEMYNNSEADLIKWYMENFPMDNTYKNSKRWRW